MLCWGFACWDHGSKGSDCLLIIAKPCKGSDCLPAQLKCHLCMQQACMGRFGLWLRVCSCSGQDRKYMWKSLVAHASGCVLADLLQQLPDAQLEALMAHCGSMVCATMWLWSCDRCMWLLGWARRQKCPSADVWRVCMFVVLQRPPEIGSCRVGGMKGTWLCMCCVVYAS